MSDHDASAGRLPHPSGLESRRSIPGRTEPVGRDARVAPNPERIAEGWEHRFVADQTRALEAMELYRELGFEVLADPITPEDLPGGCEHCRLVMQLQFRMIYTRSPTRKPAAG